MRVATSACLVASGLFLAGLGGAMAFADSDRTSEGSANESNEDAAGDRPTRHWPTRPGPTGTGESPEPSDTATSTRTTTKPPPSTTKPPTTKPTTTEPTTTKPTTTTKPSTTEPTTTKPTTTTKPSTTSETPSTPTTTTPSPWPEAPAPGGGNGGGNSGGGIPGGLPVIPPEMNIPPHVGEPRPGEPGILGAAPGLPGVVPEAPLAPIAMPIIAPPVAAPPALNIGPAGGGGAPAAPRGIVPNLGPKAEVAEAPAARQPQPPVRGGEPGAVPASYRIGYVEYLRTAGMSQVAVLAVPGTAGIVVLTAIGGLVGYRQARAGHAVRASGTARFMN